MEKKWNLIFIFFVLILIFIPLLLRKVELSPEEGYVSVTGGKVWYRIVGSGTETPLLLLQGRPGFPSYYLNPLADLSNERPIIFLDQLGCGRSDDNTDTTLMTMDTFVEQLNQVIDSLGLDKFYLYGHSWGTMLGMDYYLKYPGKVKALILASPCLSMPKWSRDCKELLKSLPDSLQLAIEANEKVGKFGAEEYQHATNIFYQHFIARELPWDANVDSTFEYANTDIYDYMWGLSEFSPTGTLQNYDRSEKLKEIKIPSLFVCGEFDEAVPSTVQFYQSLTPGSKFAMIEDAAHLTMHDNPVQNNNEIAKFLKEIEDNN